MPDKDEDCTLLNHTSSSGKAVVGMSATMRLCVSTSSDDTEGWTLEEEPQLLQIYNKL